MRSRTKALLGAAGGLFALWVGWGLYATRSAERVPYETLEAYDGVEVRRYPRTVLAETTAPDRAAAFRRLFGYISGANETDEEVAMTAPVATRGDPTAATASARALRPEGESVSMTAPVRTRTDEAGVTMAFYLPVDYTPETAPTPTDPEVRLVVEPPRTVAARRFSWYATAGRVDRERDRLLDALDDRDLTPRGDPAVLQYNDPWTPPFMRHNEVAVAVDEPATTIPVDD